MSTNMGSGRIRFLSLLCGLLVLVYRPAYAADSAEEIDALVAPIFSAIEKGKIGKLGTVAFSKGHARKYISKDAIASLNEKFENYLKDIGRFYSSSLLIESEIEDIYVNRHYVLKCEREPLLLRIGFYKPSDRWQVQNITFGESLVDMVKEASEVAIGALSTGTQRGIYSVDDIENRYSPPASN